MDVQRYIEALEKGDAPNAIVPLIVAEARKEALEEAACSFENAPTADPGTAWFNNDAAKALRALGEVH